MPELDYDALNSQFESAYPQDILRWSAATFGDRLAVVTSFQPTGIVTLHMLHDLGISADVLTLDTGLLFPETYALMEDVEQRFNLRLKRITPALTVAQQAEQYGDTLWSHDPDACCNMRKVVPLKDVVSGYAGWITGLRRDQGETRAQTPIVSWDKRNNNVKICPFANWTEEMMWTYIGAYDLPYNTLHDQNYPTIGCVPCTKPVAEGVTDLRAGRWANQNKTECGIHQSN